jgi:alpha-aminoadipate carrier protein LysW
MATTFCPECDGVISVENPREGSTLRCPNCGEELEVISSDPFEVDFPLDDDWDDDWDDDLEDDWDGNDD